MSCMLECAGFIPQVKLVKKAFDAQRGVIILASKSQKPSVVRISVKRVIHSLRFTDIKTN